MIKGRPGRRPLPRVRGAAPSVRERAQGQAALRALGKIRREVAADRDRQRSSDRSEQRGTTRADAFTRRSPSSPAAPPTEKARRRRRGAAGSYDLAVEYQKVRVERHNADLEEGVVGAIAMSGSRARTAVRQLREVPRQELKRQRRRLVFELGLDIADVASALAAVLAAGEGRVRVTVAPA